MPIPTVQGESLELLRLRAEVGVLRQFKARIEAEYAEPGHITKDEVRSALALADDGNGGTDMHWESNVKVSGTIAGVGARLMSGVADRMTKDIFECIKSKLNES